MDTVDNSKMLNGTLRKDDAILDDFMATQSYEARNIPKSPVSKDEALMVNFGEGTMPQQYSLEAIQTDDIATDNSNSGEANEDMAIQADDIATENSNNGEANEDMATQAYGGSDEICPSGEEIDAKISTQAYGLDSDNFTLLGETSGGVAAIAYEHADSDSAHPGDTCGGKVREPAVKHAQQKECMQDKELKKDNVELLLFDEFDDQSTQVYSTDVGVQDSESGAYTKHGMQPVKSDESSDNAELPSLASFGISIRMGKEATDNEEDFRVPARRSSRMRTPSKRHAAESTSTTARKSPSIVIEGENTSNSLKRCYVECSPKNEASQTNKVKPLSSCW